MPDDIRAVVVRFAETVGRQPFVSYADLDAILPKREYGSDELEAVLGYLADQGIDLVDDIGESSS